MRDTDSESEEMMMSRKILFVNACVRSDSRTLRLAHKLLDKIAQSYDEVRLEEISFPVVDEAFLRTRDSLIAAEDFANPVCDLARQFAEANTIVIAAPYWDLSFPASLKQYFEQINVLGVTFKYNEKGIPVGLCKAEKVFYVTTAGGDFAPDEYGFGYVKALAQNYYGIQDVRKIEAVGLDIYGADVDAIMKATEEEILRMTF